MFRLITLFALAVPLLWSCADVNGPGARPAEVPAPNNASNRQDAVNENPDTVLYLPLGSDVLVPEAIGAEGLPDDYIGPFELRGETLAGALQLILADYEVPLAFETNEGLTRTITVSNLQGSLDKVVERVCSLADLYCSYEDGLIVVKETQTFTVTIPPVGGDTDMLSAIAQGVAAITGSNTITESGTRTVIYEATNRTSRLAERYFQKLRANTALITYEVYIWEVSLDTSNAFGIDWQELSTLGKFNLGVDLPDPSGISNPITIGLPTTDTITGEFAVSKFLQFLSTYGAVKTISQPQITMLSGSSATLRAADTRNYVSSLSRTQDDGTITTSTETDSVDTGFTMTISSSWDNSTIYGDVEIDLQEFQQFDSFVTEGTTLQLPQTVEREVETSIRIRPGDSLLIAGLVREKDQIDRSGPGFTQPAVSTSKSSGVETTELVFLLKPRVIVYTEDKPTNTSVKPQEIRELQDYHDAALSGQVDQVEVPVDQDGGALVEEEEFPAEDLHPEQLNPSVSP